MPTAEGRRRPAEAIATVLLAAAALRLSGSVVAGFVAWSVDRDAIPDASVHAGNVLQTFGSAGDVAGALILIAAAVVIAWGGLGGTRLAVTARFLLAVTAALVVLRATGYFLISAVTGDGGVEDAIVTSTALADLLLCAAGALALRLFGAAASAAGTDDEPLVFAVDRGNGEVFAFFSYAEAARTLSVYSIADGEFDFYTDEGFVVDATVEEDDVRFQVTGESRHGALLTALRGFARTHRLDVDPPDDPGAYAIPISDWQWLELWPGWMRGVGRLVRRFGRQVGRSKSIVE